MTGDARDPGGLDAVRRAAAVVDHGVRAAAGAVVAGATDAEVLDAVCAAVEATAGAPCEIAANIGFGPDAADPDAQPTGRVLRDGDIGFLDLYPRVGTHFGDISRGLALGVPRAETVRVHAALWVAVDRGAALLRPGVACRDIDAACRATLIAHGLDAGYPHHTGHGLGIAQQQPPWITPDSADVLRAGDVVTLEPGYYRQGWGGLRVEDTFLVTATGAETLTTAPRTLPGTGVARG